MLRAHRSGCSLVAVAALSSFMTLVLPVGIALADDAGAPKRPLKAIEADLIAQTKEMKQSVRFSDAALFNPKFKQQMTTVATPSVSKRDALLKEYDAALPKPNANVKFAIVECEAELAYFGDKDARARIDAQMASTDPMISTEGNLSKSISSWFLAYGNPNAQNKLKDAVFDLGKAQPTNDEIAHTLVKMINTNPADGSTATAMDDFVVKSMKGAYAKSYAAVPNRVGAPLVVEGKTLKGDTFKSSQWAGKVILVDFWATWCPPCREEIPRVAKLYEQYHDQGFEIIGVSSDNDRQELAGFLKEHSEMPWNELFAGGTGWHPLTKKYGIDSIPRMYLIDRNGILRTMEGREEMDKLIPVLLAEKATTPTASAR